MAKNRYIWIYPDFFDAPITQMVYIPSWAVSALQYSRINLSPIRRKFFTMWQKYEISDFPWHLSVYCDVVWGPTCISYLLLIECSFAVLLNVLGVQIAAGVQEIRRKYVAPHHWKGAQNERFLGHLVEVSVARRLSLKHLKVPHRRSHVAKLRVATLMHLGY